MTTTILTGDCRELLPTLPAGSVQCCVSSPPYFRLRSYLPVDHPLKAREVGQEPTVEAFVATMVSVFREVHRALSDDGSLFLNLGDSYMAPRTAGDTTTSTLQGGKATQTEAWKRPGTTGTIDLKAKNLIGIPWRVALALQADGWILRQCNIWHKPNGMPESVNDRTTTAHEYVFHLTKSERYYYDAAAISEPVAASTVERLSQPNLENQAGSHRQPGKTNGPMKAVRGSHKGSTFHTGKTADHQLGRASDAPRIETDRRNKRSVWTIPTSGYQDAHFAVMPAKLAEICILAGSREGDTILDPFAGSGTTLGEANRLGRHGIGIDLDESCRPMIERRTAQLALEVA